MGTVSSESPKVQYSVQREQSDGSLNRISVRVPYFSKDDIHVYVDDVEINSSATEQSTYTWRWDGDYIAITPNVASGSEVLVRRITPINEAIHIFDGRSEFDDQSMDENFQQLIYIAQEYSEGSGIKDVFSDINMHGYKIRNVGWATDDDDVVTYGQYKKDADGAKVAMQKAEAAATKAEQHEQNTQAIANQAQTDITASKEAAITEITDRIAPEVDKARTHAVTAQSAAGTAVSASNRSETILQHVQVLEDEVQLHAGTAEAAKDEAIRIKDLAKDWATKLNATVDGSEYSAKHYANEAKKSADKTDSDLTAIITAKANALSAIDTSKISAVKAVTDAGSTQCALIDSEGDAQVQRVIDEGTTQVSAVGTKGTQEVQKVTSEGTKQVQAVQAEGTASAKKVTDEGTKQVGIVSAQGTTSVNAVKAQQTTSTNTVVAEGDKQIKRVTDHGTTTIGLVTAEGTEQVTRVTDTGSAQVTNVQTEGTKQVDLAKDQVTKATAQTVEATRQAERAKQYADQMATGQIQADWNETDPTSKACILNKPTLGALASKDSIAYSEITGTPPEQDLSGLATKNELQTGLAGKANASHAHTSADVTDLNATISNALKPYATTNTVNAELAKKANESHTHPISQITNLQASLDAKTNDATLQVDLTAIRESITNVSSKVDGIGATLSPTYAKKQAILDACDKALNGTNPVNAVDPTFINQLAEKLSKLGTVRPLGFHYLHPYGTVPADSIICNGATYSRALYKDFFDYITTQGWVKTEAEWQEIATRDNGFCPFYSSGDGSTNFRTPKFAPYQQIAMEVAQATQYHQAGIPNIEGDFAENSSAYKDGASASGAFKVVDLNSTGLVLGAVSTFNKAIIRFDASLYNAHYGRSSTVTPESHEWVMCVVAYGVATNVGSVDIQNVMSAVNAVQAQVGEIPTPKSYVTETWRSGAQWHRRWSDGWLEQGGRLKLEVWTGGNSPNRTFSLPTTFSNATYTTVVTGEGGYGWATLKVVSQTTSSVTVSGTGASTDDYVSYVHFYCSGY